MRFLKLTNTGQMVLVSDKDWFTLCQVSWTESSQGYAVRYEGTKKRKVILMHREILGCGPGGPEVDHINRDKLDNRRINLRKVTRSENSHNRRAMNVWKRRDTGRWTGQISKDGKTTSLGCFDTREEAEEAYTKAKKQYLNGGCDNECNTNKG